MAVVLDPRWRVTDEAGNAIVGATMTIYVAGGVTPASIYSDAGLTTPITLSGVNASDAEGYFPQWFAAEGGLFDITVKDSDGATVPDRSYVSVPALGSDTATFTRDFAASRLRARNVGGVVYIETGNASGDDVGGSGRLAGWSGTQGDDLTLDYATVNTTGAFTEGGKSLPGVIATGRTAFTAVASVAIALPNSPAGVLAWEVDAFLTGLSTIGKLSLTFSTDNGATYLATGYIIEILDAVQATATAADSATSKMELHYSVAGNGVGQPGGLVQARIIQPYITGALYVTASTLVLSAGGHAVLGRAGGFVTAAARVTHVKLSVDAGTITGAYRVMPLRGFN